MMLSWGISHSTHCQNGGSTTSNRSIGRQSMRKASCDICCINVKWMQVFIADLQMVTYQTNDTWLYRFSTCLHCPHILTQLPWWHWFLIFLSVAISIAVSEHYLYRCSRLYLITQQSASFKHALFLIGQHVSKRASLRCSLLLHLTSNLPYFTLTISPISIMANIPSLVPIKPVTHSCSN